MASAECLARDLSALKPPPAAAPMADHAQHHKAVLDCIKPLSSILSQHSEISSSASYAVDDLKATVEPYVLGCCFVILVPVVRGAEHDSLIKLLIYLGHLVGGLGDDVGASLCK